MRNFYERPLSEKHKWPNWVLDVPREINDKPSPCGEIILLESQPCVLEAPDIEDISK